MLHADAFRDRNKGSDSGICALYVVIRPENPGVAVISEKLSLAKFYSLEEVGRAVPLSYGLASSQKRRRGRNEPIKTDFRFTGDRPFATSEGF